MFVLLSRAQICQYLYDPSCMRPWLPIYSFGFLDKFLEKPARSPPFKGLLSRSGLCILLLPTPPRQEHQTTERNVEDGRIKNSRSPEHHPKECCHLLNSQVSGGVHLLTFLADRTPWSFLLLHGHYVAKIWGIPSSKEVCPQALSFGGAVRGISWVGPADGRAFWVPLLPCLVLLFPIAMEDQYLQ